MHIRQATPDDAEAIAEIYNDAILNTTAVMWHETRPVEHWRGVLADRPEHLPALVADAGQGQPVGFTLLSPYDTLCGYDDVAEWSLYVAPAWRGRGVGRSLADALFRAARAQGRLHSILSRVTAGNLPSARLHERFGFREVGTFKRLGHKFNKRYDVIAYQLIL